MVALRDRFVHNVPEENTHTPTSESFQFYPDSGDFQGRSRPYDTYDYNDSHDFRPTVPDKPLDSVSRAQRHKDGSETHEMQYFPPQSDPFADRNYDPFDPGRSTYPDPANTYIDRGTPNPLLLLAPGDTLYPAENVFASESGLADDSEQFKDSSAERRFQSQERNRRKLAALLPRFHWTRLPYFTMLVTLIQVVVFIVELARMASLTGLPFQTKPYFNPMLGPSTYLLINMGARYVPCIHPVESLTSDSSFSWPCPNSTSIDTNVCGLSELCGISGVPLRDGLWWPNQHFRVFTPMFLHAGFLHIFFNLLLQVSMGASLERSIGWLKYSIIYLASGVAGFLLGANFTPVGIASTGASGALFGILATNFLVFVYCGKRNTNIYGTRHYKTFLFILLLEVIVSLVLGLLPGLDNFSHLGGFCMGLVLSVVLLKDPSFVYIDGIYTYDRHATPWALFLQNWNPMNAWADKVASRVYWWVAVRVLCLVLAILYFVLLFKNLYSKGMLDGSFHCEWCKYFNCIPVNGWCEIGDVSILTTTSSTAPSPTLTTQVAESALPGSIVNPNQKRSFPIRDYTLEINNNEVQQTPNPHAGHILKGFGSPSSHTAAIGAPAEIEQLSLGIVAIMAFLSYCTWRHSRKRAAAIP